MHSASVPFLHSIILAVALTTATAFTQDAVIDDCKYADNAAAASAWHALWGTAPAATAKRDGRQVLRLPCNFAGTKIERTSWDRKVSLDLVPCQGVQFKLFCKNATPVAQFTVYFESGAGWYSAGFSPGSSSGWSTVTIDKTSTRSEGKPAGWGHIKTIRLSAWRGKDADTELLVSDFRKTGMLGEDASVAIVRAESLAQHDRDEAHAADQFAEAVAQNLASLGIGYAMISDLDATAERLKAAKLVILPHNSGMPDRVADELVKYANAGGKLLIFYNVPSKLRSVVKIEGGAHVKAKHPGDFSTIRFAGDALPGAPALVGQKSWNISEARPVPGASRVLAEWLDAAGQPTGHAAVVASDNAIVMTHVLLPDDASNKRRMLLAMVGHLVPDIWRRAAERSIARIGQVGGCKNFDEAARQISRNKRAGAIFADARKLRDTARLLAAQEKFPEACDKAVEADKQTMKAFCLAQQPLAGEFRAFWCHSAFGVEGMDWDAAIKRLADNGFTAILPNMLWGGAAFYDSKVLPVAPEVAEKGDQIAQCVAACKKYGVQIHVWKVNWNTGHHVPQEFLEKMRGENRLQASSQGKEEPWLCPSHPENQKLEIAAMVEVARNYDVDGIHFDYIRYPDSNHCFCAGCRDRFAKAAGVTISNWPKDVLADGPFRQQWLDWRRSNITTVVKAVNEQARAIKPHIKISAAVFSNWPTDRDGVGQDWKLWCERGWLDFVCPMDYTNSDSGFENLVTNQKEWAGKVPVYPGIGASSSHSRLPADQVIAQIQIARRHRCNGFTIFNYGVVEANELVPMLSLGITAKR